MRRITEITKYILLITLAASFMRCAGHEEEIEEAIDSNATRGLQDTTRTHCNSVYHWKTTFDLNEEEIEFLERNDVHRLYIRMFDVDLDSSPINDHVGIVPVGTTKFKCAIPDSTEVVPTVFITTKAIKFIGEDSDGLKFLAQKIYTRIQNMSSYNELGIIHEIQLDCDWTTSTQEAFYQLCREIKTLAEKDTVLVSATIRLHQLKLDPPPVDRGVLMVYNTGAIRNPGTKNSILDYEDVSAYLGKKPVDFEMPLDFAYPTFGWGVLFRNGIYQGILHKAVYDDTKFYVRNGDGTYKVRKNHFLEGHSLWEGDVIRLEYPTPDEVTKVAEFVSKAFSNNPHSTILYHLDAQNLSKYNDDEIAFIFSH